MRKRKLMRLFLLLISLGALSSCSTRIDPPKYKVYVLRLEEKMLFAHEAKDDLPLGVCGDTGESKANCWVFRRDEYLRLMRDLIELRSYCSGEF